MAFLAPIANDQQFDANGDPLSGGTIEVYLAGTSTPATTYSDEAGLVPNTWPIVLNTLGVNNQGAVWLTGGTAYKYIIKDSVGVVQRTIDNVRGINDNTGAADQWVVYQGAPTYVSATSFTVAGDRTQILQVGRRIKAVNTGGTIYGTITGSEYSAPNTTVTVINDSGALDSGLSLISYGLLSVLETSLPGGMINYGQCRLAKSGANLLLSPYNGNRITINGSVCVIPAAGVTLAPGSVTPNVVYNIYAFMSGATLTLEASTTGHSTDAITGVEIKTGDATRTLVGMARPGSGPTWFDTSTQRFVASWFNRRLRQVYRASAGALSTASLTPVALLQLEFLSWGGESSMFTTNGAQSNTDINATNNIGLGVDSTTVNSYAATTWQAYAASANGPAVANFPSDSLSEGYHSLNVLGWVSAGTASWAAPNGFEFGGLVNI